MKSIKSALLAYSSAKFILAIGTFAFLFIVGYGFVTINQTNWVLTFLTSFLALMCGFGLGAVGLFIFDGGFDHLEDVGRDANGQEAEKAKALKVQYTPMTKQERVMSYVLGTGGVIGSTVISIVAAGVFAFSVTDDKSGVSKDMQSTQADADKTYNTELSIAQAAVARAQSQLDAATAKSASATQDAIAAIGGDFAARKRRGDEWVEVAAVYSKSRSAVRTAQQNADEAKAQAEAQLSQASATLNDVLRNGKNRATAGIAPVLGAQQLVLDTWIKKVSNLRSLVVRTDLVAGFFALIFYVFLRIKRALPDEPTILEQLMRFARLTSNATVYALDVTVTGAEKALDGKMGIVAHPNVATVAHSLQPTKSIKVAFTASPNTGQTEPGVFVAQSASLLAPVAPHCAAATEPATKRNETKKTATNPAMSAILKQRDSAMSAIRNYRTAQRKAQKDFESNAITQDELSATLLHLQEMTANQEQRKSELEAQLETMKNRKA